MKKIIIIGGGIAGLSAGIFAQMSGFQSVILEKHHTPGGECTGWDREGYHIDGCIHWLVGTKEGTGIRTLWDRVGALEDVEIYHPESFMAVEHESVTVHFYRDLNRMRESWIAISPEDRDAIEELCKDIGKLHSFSLPAGKPMDMMNPIEKVKFMLSMKDVGPVMQKYDKISIQALSQKFRHPALREAIASFMPEGEYSASSVIFPLGTFTGDQSSIPMGGSKALALRMAEKFISLGGTLETTSEVEDLVIEGNMVKQVISSNGAVHEGDYVIAACDPKVLYEGLLKGEYNDPAFEKRYKDSETYPLASNLYVGIGYEGTMEEIPRTLKFPVDSLEIMQNRKPIGQLQMTHYGYEPAFAPEGHTAITFAINQFQPELEEWESLSRDREAYRKEKERIGAEVIRGIETRFPEMKGKLKVLDVATPHTYTRYCNAYKGAFMGFWPTLSGKQMNHNGKIKGLDNLVLSGQWLQPPGGLPVALITGKDSIMRLCKRLKKPFVEA